jgi:hypothetical protein
MVQEFARPSENDRRDGQETADALDRCLALADEVERARALVADLRGQLAKVQQPAATATR